MSRYDLVLWGATGFTGTLVAEYLAREAPSGFDWAIGGRDRRKLAELAARLGEPGIVVADARDGDAMRDLAESTRVVASTVGPYARHGTPLVEACVAAGIAYCDITGETHWIRDNVDRLHEPARASGARIVHCCGFDSIPSDLGVWMLHDALTREHGRALRRADYYLTRVRGGLSGGTVASMFELIERAASDRELRRVLVDPYALNPPGERSGPDRPDQRDAREVDGRHTAPFVMAAINTRIVRRTNALLDYPYGREFRYSEATSLPSRAAARRTALLLKVAMIGAALAPTRWLMRRFAPSPGSGPSREERENGRFRIEIDAESDGDPTLSLLGRVGCDADPGYGATSLMLGESALCLALDRPEGPAGILTPAAAMARPLLERLRRAGMRFDVERAAG